MNRYILIRRLRGPAFLLLIGVLALLSQADILSWGKSWPLFLILAGVLALAERAAMASEGPYAAYPGAPYPGGVAAAAAPTQGTTAIVPADSPDQGRDSEGGQS